MSIKEDASTNDVIQWLNYYKAEFIRLDYHEIYNLEYLNISNNSFEFIIKNRDKIINLNKINAFWYRRGKLNLFTPEISISIEIDEKINNHIYRENIEIENLFYKLLRNKPSIGSFETYTLNKLEVLFLAKEIGLKIPDTAIFENSKYFKTFSTYKGIITKSINENFAINTNYGSFSTYTELVKKIEKNRFFISLFQNKIEKDCDIRSFYFFGNFYSMAILSQNSKQTMIDFRKYNRINPNRNLPVKLPLHIENKLKLLMRKLNLNTGSIDLILDRKGRFIFLEINPIGQFGMTSYPCNYNLEKIIAKKLINLSKYE